MGRTHFGCDACAHPIAPSDPRIRCLECPEYDLCAACALGERFTGAHSPAHRTRVFKMSGSGATQGVPANTAIVYVDAAQTSFPLSPEASPESAPRPALPHRSPPPPHKTALPSPPFSPPDVSRSDNPSPPRIAALHEDGDYFQSPTLPRRAPSVSSVGGSLSSREDGYNTQQEARASGTDVYPRAEAYAAPFHAVSRVSLAVPTNAYSPPQEDRAYLSPLRADTSSSPPSTQSGFSAPREGIYQLSPDDQSYKAPPRADTYATPSRATPASSVPQRQDGYFPPQTSPAHIAAPRADTTETPLRGDASYAIPPHADSPVRREDGYLPSQDDRTPPVGAYTSPLRVTPAPGIPQREDGYRPPQDARAPPHGDTYQAETYSTSPQASSPASVPRREGTHLSRPEDRISGVGGYTPPHTEVYAAPQRADPAPSAPPREEYRPLRDDSASNIGGYTPPPRADAPVSRGETYSAPPRYAYAPSPRADTRTAPPRTNASTAPGGYSPPARADTVEPVRGWGPFFAEDISPTPVLTQLLDALFAYLDTGRTGYLAPEDYSRFLVNQGYVGAENVWNANLTASLGKTKKESADAALKRNYDALGIEHVLRPRTPDRPAAVTTPPTLTRTLQSFGASFARTLAAPPPGSSAMPLLTRKGFADITAIALLTDPARACGALARVLRMYELPLVRGWGALPRGVLPAEADPRMLERVSRGTAAAKSTGTRERGERIVQSVFAVENAVAAANLASDTLNTLTLVGNTVSYISN